MQGCAEVKREVNLMDVSDTLGKSGSFSCDVVMRARELADFLAGPEPEGNSKGCAQNPPGIVYELEGRADYLAAQLHEALRQLNRAASRLGMPPTALNAAPTGPRLARG